MSGLLRIEEIESLIRLGDGLLMSAKKLLGHFFLLSIMNFFLLQGGQFSVPMVYFNIFIFSKGTRPNKIP